MHIYIYIYIERKRERDLHTFCCARECLCRGPGIPMRCSDPLAKAVFVETSWLFCCVR